jgi:hypothetical protein
MLKFIMTVLFRKYIVNEKIIREMTDSVVSLMNQLGYETVNTDSKLPLVLKLDKPYTSNGYIIYGMYVPFCNTIFVVNNDKAIHTLLHELTHYYQPEAIVNQAIKDFNSSNGNYSVAVAEMEANHVADILQYDFRNVTL